MKWFTDVSADVTSSGKVSFIMVNLYHSSSQRRYTMKKFARYSAWSAAMGVAVLLSTSVALSAKSTDDVWFKGTPVDLIEQNLAVALRMHSDGIQASASQVVRDLKGLLPSQEFTSVIIPLMGIVKNEDGDPAVRTVAALALYDLKSSRGDFALSQMARFSRNDRIKHLCAWLTYERNRQSTFARPVSGTN